MLHLTVNYDTGFVVADPDRASGLCFFEGYWLAAMGVVLTAKRETP